MIQSTSSSDGTNGTDPLSLRLRAQGERQPVTPDNDSMSTDQADQLRSALAQDSEVRPEAVARGMALASDPSYPSADVIRGLASIVLNSPDPSEDLS